MTQLLDEKSNGLLTAISGKGQELAGEVGRRARSGELTARKHQVSVFDMDQVLET